MSGATLTDSVIFPNLTGGSSVMWKWTFGPKTTAGSWSPSVALSPEIPGSSVNLQLSSLTVSRSLPALRAYWARRLRLTDASSLEIDWSALSRAMKALPAYLQRYAGLLNILLG